MNLDAEGLRNLVEAGRGANRFTQDSPAMPDVWLGFAETDEGERLDLLLTPVDGVDPVALAAELEERLPSGADAGLAYSGSFVVAELDLKDLVRAALPLSDWWDSEHTWLSRVLGAVTAVARVSELPIEVTEAELDATGQELLADVPSRPAGEPPLLERVTRNRQAEPAVIRSRKTVKADAVASLFEVECSRLSWAVLDTGIDATHPAFRLRDESGEETDPASGEGEFRSRVVATYDMTLLRAAHRAALAGKAPGDDLDTDVVELLEQYGDELEEMRTHLLDRAPLNWDLLEPLLRVPHTTEPDERKRKYEKPKNPHGSHVAGILAGNWPDAPTGATRGRFAGICPDLRLYDIRVFPNDPADESRKGDEFTVAAALQLIDYLNGYGRKVEIVGANASISVPYELAAFGCGQTPVCQEANRLVAGGAVVVAAAGNRGREEYTLEGERVQGFRMVSITDPGNAEDVITVGSAHSTDPHAYGVSHFSSRGPTADGRRKPDLVAPGEKILAPALNDELETEDGTSQAAAHVSGAAALLLARHRELIGKPQQVKRLLMDSATDLEREAYFQGAGLVDALRTAQAN